jgi:hypothetical protein
LIRALATAAAAALVCVPAAAAHISVTPARAAAGATVRLVFDTPNEREDVQVVAVRLEVPAAFRIARAESPPQWRAVRRGATVEWSGGLIAPEETQRFAIAGRIERTATFRASERFSDGGVARYEPRVVVPGADSSGPGTLVVLVAVVGAALAAFGAGLAFWLRGATLQDS